MRHGVAGRKLGRPTQQRMLMLRGLVTEVLRYDKVVTTEARARETRPLAEKMITLGKDGTLHARRQAAAVLLDPLVVQKVFDILARRFAERPGGYTRIVKLGPRVGDAAKTAVLSLVD